MTTVRGIDNINTGALRDTKHLRVVGAQRSSFAFFSKQGSNPKAHPNTLLKVGIGGSIPRRAQVPVTSEPTQEAVGRFISNKVTGQYIKTCKDIGVDYEHIASITAFIICNMKGITHSEVFERIFNAKRIEVPFVDWGWARENIVDCNQNSLGDTSCWLTFLHNIHFTEEVQTEVEALGYFSTFRSLLRGVGFVGPDEIWVTDVIKVYLLLNIVGLTGYHAMERYLDEIIGGNIRTRCLQFTAKLGDQRFTTEEYNEAAVTILGCITVAPTFQSDIQVYMFTKQEIDKQMKQKEIEVYQGRPRLTTYLKDIKAESRTAISAQNMHTFDVWMNFVKFPNTISKKTRHSVYLLMSMPTVNHHEWINRCLTKDLASTIVNNPVINPEYSVICNIISNIDFRSHAFLELAKFKDECLDGLSQKNMKEMTLSRLLQLYVSAYQVKHIWKDCWRHVLPVLSFPVIQSVETFVGQNPINEAELFKALMFHQ